jgi:hypothetical protein
MPGDPFCQLKRAYDAQRLVLALGAGVSVGWCLPDWDRLLRTLVRMRAVAAAIA